MRKIFDQIFGRHINCLGLARDGEIVFRGKDIISPREFFEDLLTGIPVNATWRRYRGCGTMREFRHAVTWVTGYVLTEIEYLNSLTWLNSFEVLVIRSNSGEVAVRFCISKTGKGWTQYGISLARIDDEDYVCDE